MVLAFCVVCLCVCSALTSVFILYCGGVGEGWWGEGRRDGVGETLEKYHTFKICKDNLHMNDTNLDIHNSIFEALHKIYTR
jgi:hypothetical protein